MLPEYIIRDQPVEQLSSLELSLKVVQASHLHHKMSQPPTDDDFGIDSDSIEDPRVKRYKEKYFRKLSECNETHGSTVLNVIRAVRVFFFEKYS